MGVFWRSYAAQRGVSEAAVRKAIATGRITTLPDGTIDPARADSEWGAQTDPAKQRGQHAKQIGAETAVGTAKAAIGAVADTLRDAGIDPGSPEATSGEVPFLRARMANEVLKAQTAKVRLEKMNAEVINRARATAMVFDLARRERDAWLKWPPLIASFSDSRQKSVPSVFEMRQARNLRLCQSMMVVRLSNPRRMGV
jgi:hypothetical protein